MFAKNKGQQQQQQQIPSDIQAKEKLAHYVYEYLMHLGAKQSAQTFLQEIRWEKNMTLGEAPGFLTSWWCVFWDLYCAAPERRNQFEVTEEAKLFHDLSQFNRMPPGAPRGMRVQQHSTMDFPGNLPNPPTNSNSSNSNMNIDANRIPPGINQMNRLTPPGSRGMPLNNQQQQPTPQQSMNNIGFNNQAQVPQPQHIRQVQNNTNQTINAPMSPMPMGLNQQQQQHVNRWSGPTQQQPPQPQTPTGYHDQNINMHSVQINNDMQQINGDMIDSVKNSPISSIPGRHHEDYSANSGAMPDLNPYNNFGDNHLF